MDQCFTHVHVKPKLVFLADIGYLWDRVECTDDRRPCRCIYEERYVTFGLAFKDEFLQLRRYYTAAFVARHHNAIVGTQAANGSARFHGIMALISTRQSITCKRVTFTIDESVENVDQRRVYIMKRDSIKRKKKKKKIKK